MDSGGDSSPSYIALPGLLYRSWDELLTVVFDPSSAQTHLLSAAAAGLLRDAAHTSVSLDKLAPDVADGEPDGALRTEATTPAERAEILQALDSLHRAGLLRPLP